MIMLMIVVAVLGIVLMNMLAALLDSEASPVNPGGRRALIMITMALIMTMGTLIIIRLALIGDALMTGDAAHDFGGTAHACGVADHDFGDDDHDDGDAAHGFCDAAHDDGGTARCSCFRGHCS